MVRVYFEIDMAKFKLIVHVVMLVYSQNEEFLNGRRNKLLKFIMDSVLVRMGGLLSRRSCKLRYKLTPVCK